MILRISYDGNLIWSNEKGLLHRENGPAFIGIDGRIQYCRDNALHRLDGPAMIYSHGAKLYYIYGFRYHTKKAHHARLKDILV